MKFINKMKRLFNHLNMPLWRMKRYFSPEDLASLKACIAQSEAQHTAQICFVVESGWDWHDIWQDKTPRERALEWFSLGKVWDTAENNGVLIYWSFADHALEIVADRGFNQKVSEEQWQSIGNIMESSCHQHQFVAAMHNALHTIGQLAQTHFARKESTHPNELPDDIILH